MLPSDVLILPSITFPYVNRFHTAVTEKHPLLYTRNQRTFSIKGQEQIGLFGPCRHCCKNSCKHCVNKWGWVGANKTLFTKMGRDTPVTANLSYILI